MLVIIGGKNNGVVNNLNQNGAIPNELPLEIMRNSIENKNLLVNKNSFYIGTGKSSEVSIGGNKYALVQTTSTSVPQRGGCSVLFTTKDPSGISVNWGTPSFSQINQDTTPVKVTTSGILSAIGITEPQIAILQNFLSLLTISGDTLIFNGNIAANEVLLNEST